MAINQNNYDPDSAIHRNTGLTQRTMYRADDAYTIHVFKSDLSNAFSFLGEMLVGFVYVWFMISIGFGILVWFGAVKL